MNDDNKPRQENHKEEESSFKKAEKTYLLSEGRKIRVDKKFELL